MMRRCRGRQPRSSTEQRRYKPGVYIMSFGFVGIFMSFNVALSLATSLNGTLGYICLATLYGTFTFACIWSPKIVNYLGPRLSMMLGAAPYIGAILANISPSYYWSVPTNFLVGLGAPLLWTGEGVYVARCALQQAFERGTDAALTTSNFNAVFFSLYQTNGIIGLSLSSIILGNVPGDTITILFIVMGAIAAVGIFALSFIPAVAPPAQHSMNINNPSELKSGDATAAAEVSLLETLKLARKDRRMTFMIPIIFYNGMALAFVTGDFTRLVISPQIGVHMTGYVLAVFYLFVTLGSWACARRIGRYLGRRGMMLFAGIFHLAIYILLLFLNVEVNYVMEASHEIWQQVNSPTALQYVTPMLIAAALGLGDAVFESQPPAILATFFQRSDIDLNAAMSNLKMWQSLGFTMQFVIGFLLDHNLFLKAAILIAALAVGGVCVVILNTRLHPLDYEPEQAPLLTSPPEWYNPRSVLPDDRQ